MNLLYNKPNDWMIKGLRRVKLNTCFRKRIMCLEYKKKNRKKEMENYDIIGNI